MSVGRAPSQGRGQQEANQPTSRRPLSYKEGPPRLRHQIERAFEMMRFEDVRGWDAIGEADPTVVYSTGDGFCEVVYSGLKLATMPLPVHRKFGRGAMRQ